MSCKPADLHHSFVLQLAVYGQVSGSCQANLPQEACETPQPDRMLLPVYSPSRGTISGKVWQSWAASHPVAPGDIVTLSRLAGHRCVSVTLTPGTGSVAGCGGAAANGAASVATSGDASPRISSLAPGASGFGGSKVRIHVVVSGVVAVYPGEKDIQLSLKCKRRRCSSHAATAACRTLSSDSASSWQQWVAHSSGIRCRPLAASRPAAAGCATPMARQSTPAAAASATAGSAATARAAAAAQVAARCGGPRRRCARAFRIGWLKGFETLVQRPAKGAVAAVVSVHRPVRVASCPVNAHCWVLPRALVGSRNTSSTLMNFRCSLAAQGRLSTAASAAPESDVQKEMLQRQAAVANAGVCGLGFRYHC